MKIRNGFVSNSSSSSFIVRETSNYSLGDFANLLKKYIYNKHQKEKFVKYDYEKKKYVNIRVTKKFIESEYQQWLKQYGYNEDELLKDKELACSNEDDNIFSQVLQFYMFAKDLGWSNEEEELQKIKNKDGVSLLDFGVEVINSHF